MSAAAKIELEAALQALALTASLLEQHAGLMRRFLAEHQRMESFGHIIAPTMFRDPVRRRMSDAMKPAFEAALRFVAAVNTCRSDMHEIAAASPLPRAGEGQGEGTAAREAAAGDTA